MSNTVLENPYVGPRTFETKEKDFFFGRAREAMDLLSLVISERLVLFYAQSGAGKSSLINTELIPGLIHEGEYKILPVGRLLGDSRKGSEVKNIYIHNLIGSLTKRGINESLLSKLTLSEFLGRLDFDEKDGYFYNENTSRELIPSEDETIWKHVLIIDQFEELFTYYQEEWEKREDFFRQLAQAMQDFPHLWVVLVMREDYIAYLDPYAYLLPGRLRVRYYMQRLSQDAAIEAVEGPARKCERSYAEGVAAQLVQDLSRIKVRKTDSKWETQTGQFVEPVQLQVVCSRLWKKLPPDKVLITSEDLKLHIGDINKALGNYYEERVKAVAGKDRTQETGLSERAIRNWFGKELITPGGIRGMVLREQNGKSGSLDDEVVQKFQGDLVRAEKRGDATWYELTHDRLVEPILESNKEWFEKNSSLLQKQTALWVAQGRPDGMLLRGNELEQVKLEAKSKTISRDEVDFLAACNKARERERRERRGNRLVQIMAVGATIASVAALVLWNQASTKAIEADLERKKAEAALTAAADSLSTAESANEEADAARGIIEAEALAGKAQIILSQSDSVRLGQLLAVEAYKINNSAKPGEILPSVYQALFKSAGTGKGIDLSLDDRPFSSASFSGDVSRKWLAVDNILWNLEDTVSTPLDIESDEVVQSSFLPDEKIILLTPNTDYFSYEQNPYNVDVIDLNSQEKTQINLTIPQNAYHMEVNLSTNARWATITYGLPEGRGGAQLWDINSPSIRPTLRLLAQSSEAVSTVVSNAGDRVAMIDNESLYLYRIDAAPKSDLLTPVFTLALDLGFNMGLLPGDSGRSIKYSDDGQRLAVLTLSNIRIYETNTGKIVAGFPLVESDEVVGFLFSPDGKYLVYTVRSRRGTTRVLRWLLEDPDPKPFEFYRSNIADITAMDISNSGKLIIGDEAGYVRAWDVYQDGNDALLVVSAHAGRIVNLLVGPDDQTIISASEADGTRLWELTEGATEAIFVHRIFNTVSSIAHSDDGETLVVGGINPDFEIGDIRVYSNLQAPDQLADVAFSSEGGSYLGPVAVSNNWIAAARTDKRSYLEAEFFLDFWKRNAGDTQRTFVTFPLSSAVSSLAFYPDGQYLAITSSTGELWIDDTTDLNKIMESLTTVPEDSLDESTAPQLQLIHKAKLPNDLTNIQSLLFTQNNKYLIGASTFGVRVWDLQTLGTEFYLPLPNAVYPIRISPDQKWLITAGIGNVVQLFDLENITSPAIVFGADNATITQFTFSTKSDWLAVATKIGKISVFDFSDTSNLSQPTYTLRGPAAEIASIQFSPTQAPGGEWLVAGSGKVIYLWNMNRLDDKPIVLEGLNGRVVYAGFTSDGQWIAAAFDDQTLRHWSMDLRKVSNAACKFAGRNLRRAEWGSYFPKILYTLENADTCGESFQYGLEDLITVTAGSSPTPGPTLAFIQAPTMTPVPAVLFTTYIVKEGDNLVLIALNFGIDINTLIADNGITDANLIVLGQSLKIRVTSTPTPP